MSLASIAAIKAGRPVIVVDDEDRENDGDLVFAAELATAELLAFTVRHTSGYVCAPATNSNADRLQLPPMYHANPRGDRHWNLRRRQDAHDPVAGGMTTPLVGMTFSHWFVRHVATSPFRSARTGRQLGAHERSRTAYNNRTAHA